MKILLHSNHTPYAYNLASLFPDFRFYCPTWKWEYRPIPKNVEVIAYDSVKPTFDAIIEDDFRLPFSGLSCKRKIFVQHCEHDDGDVTKVNNLKGAIDWADSVVVVSDHKRATMRRHSFSPKVHTIELSFDVNEWSHNTVSDSGIVGTWHNLMQPQHIDFFRAVSQGFPHLLIGENNENTGFTYYEPNNFEDMQKQVSKISVFIHVIVGEVFGMSPLEAMASGIPMITGNCPEPWSFCFNGWNCFISRNQAVDSVDWIRERIRYLVENREARQAMGQAAKESVADYFRRLKTRDKWLNLLQ